MRRRMTSGGIRTQHDGPMDSQTILRFMSDPATPAPKARDIAVTYAHLLATISDRLDPGELESFISIGVALKRSVRWIPMVKGSED